MCHDDDFKDEQCMKRETLGNNEFVWVRKCKGAKVCVDLPYYGKTIGACSIKVRSHYDGEICANGNKCTSGICDGTKCKGLNPDVECNVYLSQCKKGYVCRPTSSGAYTCQKPIDNNGNCIPITVEHSSDSDAVYHSLYEVDLFNPSTNPCKLGYVCSSILKPTDTSTSYKCVEIGSQSTGTEVSNPLACSKGFAIPTAGSDIYTCASTSDGNSYTSTSKGAMFTKLSNISTAFDNWQTEWKKKDLKDEDANYVYRYTKNKKAINKAFFQYAYAPFVQDADECAFDYMWKQNSSNSLKFSLMILVLALLF
jgi:hypothetical protein